MGFPYFDMDITDVISDIQTFRAVKKELLLKKKLFLNPKSKMQSKYYEIPDDILVSVSMNNY